MKLYIAGLGLWFRLDGGCKVYLCLGFGLRLQGDCKV